MNKILARNIDSKFWNVEFLAADILKSIETHGSAVLDFNLEGPDFKETNLYRLFEYLKNTHDVDLSKITICTGNFLEDQNTEYKIKINFRWMYELAELQKSAHLYLPTVKKNQTAKKFGLFIGRSNYARLAITGHVHAKYKDDTLLTFHYESRSDYHKAHLGFEDLLHKYGPNSEIVINSFDLIRKSPLLLEEANTYPLNNPECYKILSWYNDFFVEIICETFFTGNTFFPTEKTWRAIASKTPFVVQGPTNFLKRLKKLGFKTFDRWWDESYDNDPYEYKLTAILRVIDDIGQFKDMHKIYLEMEETLEHNFQVFKNLTTNKIQEIVSET